MIFFLTDIARKRIVHFILLHEEVSLQYFIPAIAWVFWTLGHFPIWGLFHEVWNLSWVAGVFWCETLLDIAIRWTLFQYLYKWSRSSQPFLWLVICYERHSVGERWSVLLLGGAKLKFVLATGQSIPKAHSIKYFSLLKNLKVEFTSVAAAVCIQYCAMQSTLRDLCASYHTSMKQESLLDGCLIGICPDKYAQPSWSGTELNSVPAGIFWVDLL